MTWIKLDDRAVDHPKVAGLTDRAFRWWIRGLSYASTYLTDGSLPRIFWKSTPKQTRSELTKAGLWEWVDPNFQIHDYLAHQSSKDAVNRQKERTADRVKRFRERHGNAVTELPRNAVSNAVSNAHVTPPEIRDQIQRSEVQSRAGGNGPAVAPLVMSPLQYERRKQQCAFVGSRLEVPHILHGELRKLLGGQNAETDLMAWYLDLNDELEQSGEKIPADIFRWLKARYTQWLQATDDPAKRAVDIVNAHLAKKARGGAQ